MATDLGEVKSATGARLEMIVAERLTRARRRIRVLDVAGALLALSAATLGYGLVMSLCDRAWELPAPFRLVAFGLFFLSAFSYLFFALFLPLLQQVSARYAARQLERTVPEAKNSIINWLDLHEEKLPSAIRTALGRKAASDLARTDLHQAVSVRPVRWLGGIVGGLLLFWTLLYCFIPGQFWSLMGRAFAPYGEGTIARETRLAEPTVFQEGAVSQHGNAEILQDQPVTIEVRVEGKIPPAAHWNGSISLTVQADADGRILGFSNVPAGVDPRALMLHVRDSGRGLARQYPLEHDADNRWKITLPADLVRNGFYYRVTGGDAQTPEYHIKTRVKPLVDLDRSEVRYHYPSWLERADETKKDFNLRAVRGTEVVLLVRTNRQLRAGKLEVDLAGEKRIIPGNVRAEEPDTLSVSFAMEFNAHYRIRFTSQSGEEYDEAFRYSIEVIPYSEITYRYRPYLGLNDEISRKPGLQDVEALRGTEVSITYHANQNIENGTLTLQQGARKPVTLKARAGAQTPAVLHFDKFVLDQNGTYRLSFVNPDETTTDESQSYRLKVILDNPPRAVLTRPGKEIELPANGILPLEGEVTDDIGIKEVTLRLQVIPQPDPANQKKIDLKPKPYRPEKPLKTGLGRYPRQLEYKDFVDLGQVRTDRNEPFALKPGMTVEYWLEATDTCDYPDPKGQVGKSESFRVIIRAPQSEQKQKQDRTQAQQQKKRHDKKQDETLNNQKEPPPQGRPQEQKEKKPGGKEDKGNPEQKTSAGGNGSQTGESKEKDDERKDIEKKSKQIEQALDKEKGGRDKQSSKKDGPNGKQSGKPSDERKESSHKEKANPDGSSGNTQPEKSQGNGTKGDATSKDVENLKDQLQKGNPEERNQARQDLSQVARDARDPKVQKAAQEALKQAEKDKAQPRENNGNPAADKATSQNVQDLQNKLQNGDKKEKEAAKKDLERIAKEAQNPEAQKAAREALKQAEKKNAQAQANKDGGLKPEKATPQDVNKLQDKLQAGDSKQKEQAAEDLKRIAKEAQNPEVQKAAQEALKQAEKKNTQAQANKDGGLKPEKATPQDVNKLQDKLQAGDSKEKEQAAEDLKRIAKEAQNPEVQKAAQEALKQAEKKNTQAQANKDGGLKPEKATPQDVNKLQDKLQAGDSKEKEQAAEDLKRIAKEAQNPEVQKAAQEALKQAEKKNTQAQDGGLKPEKATPQDVNKLQDKLQAGDSKEKEQAAEDLKRIAKEAQNPEAQNAAREALKQAEKKNNNGQETSKRDPKAESASSQDVNDLAKQLQPGKTGREKDEAAKQLERIAQQAKNEQAREAAKDALKKAGRKPDADKTGTPSTKRPQGTNEAKAPPKGSSPATSRQRPGDQGKEPDPQGQKADADSAREATDLNIENLRKKLQSMSPEEREKILKKANLTPKEYAEWVKKVEEYAKQRKKASSTKADTKNRSARGGSLPSSAPRRAARGGPTESNAETQKVIHPPEYKAALERLTGGNND